MSALNFNFFRNLIQWPASAHETVPDQKTSLPRVMLIESNEIDRRTVGQILRQSFEVVEFGDEYDAVSYIRRNRVDIALINDAVLQNINAGRILFTLRENSKEPFRAFALTSHFSDLQRAYLTTAGFEQVLAKPMNAVMFSDLVYFSKVLN